MRLRTPAIRRDRPTVRGSPALRARSNLRVWCQLNFPQRTIRVMLRTTRVRASIWSRTAFQNVVFKFGKGLNNRAENSHQPTRRRERQMKRFKS